MLGMGRTGQENQYAGGQGSMLEERAVPGQNRLDRRLYEQDPQRSTNHIITTVCIMVVAHETRTG